MQAGVLIHDPAVRGLADERIRRAVPEVDVEQHFAPAWDDRFETDLVDQLTRPLVARARDAELGGAGADCTVDVGNAQVFPSQVLG